MFCQYCKKTKRSDDQLDSRVKGRKVDKLTCIGVKIFDKGCDGEEGKSDMSSMLLSTS